jgi:hypothetical protein
LIHILKKNWTEELKETAGQDSILDFEGMPLSSAEKLF